MSALLELVGIVLRSLGHRGDGGCDFPAFDGRHRSEGVPKETPGCNG